MNTTKKLLVSKANHGKVFETEGARSRGVRDILKDFNQVERYGWSFEDDLETKIDADESMGCVYDLSNQDLALAIPGILKEDGLTIYNSMQMLRSTNIELVQHIRTEFIAGKHQMRIRKLWTEINLSRALREDLDKSEVEVYKNVSAKLNRIQKKWNESYRHSDIFRYRLVDSADLPHVETYLTDPNSETPPEATSRIASLLFHEQK